MDLTYKRQAGVIRDHCLKRKWPLAFAHWKRAAAAMMAEADAAMAFAP